MTTTNKASFVTVQQAAAELNLSVHTIRSWVAQRRLTSVHLGRAVRIPVAEIERLVQRGTVPAARETR